MASGAALAKAPGTLVLALQNFRPNEEQTQLVRIDLSQQDDHAYENQITPRDLKQCMSFIIATRQQNETRVAEVRKDASADRRATRALASR